MPNPRKPKAKVRKKETKIPTKAELQKFLIQITKEEIKEMEREIKQGKKGKTNFNYFLTRINDLEENKRISKQTAKKLRNEIRKRTA